MVKKAASLLQGREGAENNFMTDHDFDFIITGEVIGQRPKSQRKSTMPIIASESGADDRLLRPLCAKLLPPTLPEREGWVDREALFDFSGRNRKPQMALAESLGFEDWAQPAGGCCFLTDAQYSNKLVDLWEARGSREYELDDVMLLKVGRHLRPAPNFKLIIGRELGENRYLEGYRNTYPAMYATSHNGPLCLIDGEPGSEDLSSLPGFSPVTARAAAPNRSRSGWIRRTAAAGAQRRAHAGRRNRAELACRSLNHWMPGGYCALCPSSEPRTRFAGCRLAPHFWWKPPMQALCRTSLPGVGSTVMSSWRARPWRMNPGEDSSTVFGSR